MLPRLDVGADQFQAVLIRVLSETTPGASQMKKVYQLSRYLSGLLAIVLPLVMHTSSRSQTSYPMLMSVEPAAAQVGKASEHVVKSRYSMQGAYEVVVSGRGVHGEVVQTNATNNEKPTSNSNESLRVRFRVEPDAVPGVRDFRIATPHGVSTVGQLVIVRDSIIEESTENLTAGQTVSLPAAICGRIEKAEDVDQFRFTVTKGQALVFHVLCMRLQDRIHDLQQHADPILILRNSTGSTIASSDNGFRGDPFIYHKFEQDGEHTLEIRDVRYQGNNYWGYVIEVNDRPFVSSIYPIGLVAGRTTPVQLIGWGLPQQATAEISLPQELNPGPTWWPVGIDPHTTRPVSIVVSNTSVQIESLLPNNKIDQAETCLVPGGVNGRVESDGDIDYFQFEAVKGNAYSFEVFASRVQSLLDSHLRILDAKGTQLQFSDDIRIGKRNYSDSIVENWVAPADGKYFIEIRDLHLRGGESYTYFLKISRSDPHFELFADTDKTLLTPTTTGVVFVRAERHNGANGEIQLGVEGLPKGVTASCGRILAGAQDGCIVFQAPVDAQPTIANVKVTGVMKMAAKEDSTTTLTSQALVYQETYQPGGGRGHWPVDNHALSVGAAGDIRAVEVDTYDVVLKPGQSTRLDIKIERAPGFDKNVLLEVTYMHLNSIYGNSLPEGVTVDAAASNTLLTGGATQGHIVLKCADSARPVTKQQFAVMANVSINFVMKATYASRPMFVTIEK